MYRQFRQPTSSFKPGSRWLITDSEAMCRDEVRKTGREMKKKRPASRIGFPSPTIRITCSAGKGIWVEGDRARMKQVVLNLLDNAIKYTPQGGSVGLTVSAHGGKAILEVADNGIGIPAEALPRAF